MKHCISGFMQLHKVLYSQLQILQLRSEESMAAVTWEENKIFWMTGICIYTCPSFFVLSCLTCDRILLTQLVPQTQTWSFYLCAWWYACLLFLSIQNLNTRMPRVQQYDFPSKEEMDKIPKNVPQRASSHYMVTKMLDSDNNWRPPPPPQPSPSSGKEG